jgi:hypothetical protein
MKTVRWVLIACRIMSVSFGLTLLNSGCGDQSGISGGVSTEEEVKRDAETREAMEAASKVAKKK